MALVCKRGYVMLAERVEDDSIIEWVDNLLKTGLKRLASDIHIEPQAQHYRIRLRLDGLLVEWATLAHHLATRIITRLKIMAHLNIAEKRLPQDGRLHWTEHPEVNIRLSACPTAHGEKIALRLFSAHVLPNHFLTLGMNEQQQQQLLQQLNMPQGLILISGPTGAGKTLTLYAALKQLNQSEKNLCSVEDPIEMTLPGVNQIAVQPKIGLDFAMSLRSLLRQDPDLIMIGEIRDAETAGIALQAAQTGHLVLASVHADSARAAIKRLQALGVSEQSLLTCLNLIIGQRLIRILCPLCKEPDLATQPQPAFRAQGCAACQQGYHGRQGIFEVLSQKELRQFTQHHPLQALWQAGLTAIKQGMTSYPELVRVLGDLRAHL